MLHITGPRRYLHSSEYNDSVVERKLEPLFGFTSRLLVLLPLLLSGCTTTATINGNPDPFENFNRPIHNLNHKLDTALLKPVAKAYEKTLPTPIRNSIRNFFYNLGEPNTIANCILQGKRKQAIHSFVRFFLNSTAGVGGLIDVASHGGLKKHKEDLGQTLAIWGLAEGPYLVIPLVGPSTLRDLPNRFIGKYTNPFNYWQKGSSRISRGITGTLNTRAQVTGSIKKIDDTALDRYIFVREAYLDSRKFDIFDGSPPIEDLIDDEMLFQDDDFFFEEKDVLKNPKGDR
ncbi:MAG: putative phospholipid-binding lipoprotein MlaA [Candidatus Moanabacter tarae]|uniref:Putative phospholipid-binding lipoprotein MlaA n=1 Tax=Candidatus Moanibacter tarae TaxID=2200854 RepID=A0A2Z4AKQ0_9BACT|nr:MAG: putative phospholipid-binding lipoprotein MlaA [Candidatus Moanabacter tarae]